MSYDADDRWRTEVDLTLSPAWLSSSPPPNVAEYYDIPVGHAAIAFPMRTNGQRLAIRCQRR